MRHRWAALMALGTSAGLGAILPATPAAAASCRVMIVQNNPPAGLALSPRQVDVAYAGCVQFTDNAVGPAVTVTVAGGYSVVLTYGESTSGANSYRAKVSGTHAVTASNGAASVHGSIVVGASPSPSPSPSATHSPSPSPSARPRPSSSQSSSSGPQVAPSPNHSTHRPPPVPSLSAQPAPSASLVTPAPGLTPSLPAPTPTPTSTTSPVAIVAGPLQPPTDRGLGLPAAVAALALVGVGAALVRVLLAAAPAVDNRGTVGGPA